MVSVQEDTEMDGLFMRDVMLAKVDDHTAMLKMLLSKSVCRCF